MRRFEVSDVTLEVVQGDIASQTDIEAVVNAANAQLRTGGGVAGAIHRAAGPGLTDETREYAPIEPGEAVITGGHDLPNDHVIHCLGPRWGVDSPADELLSRCYDRALELAENQGLESIAFPAISTGAFDYPFDEATDVALDTVLSKTGELTSLKRIRFVLYSEDQRDAYEDDLSSRVQSG